ncbi:uncharacterized protein METZ01_LOCUS292126, partial [marine metagenome]
VSVTLLGRYITRSTTSPPRDGDEKRRDEHSTLDFNPILVR